LGIVVGRFFSQRIGALMLVVFVVLAGVFGGIFAPTLWLVFRNEGPNRPSLPFSEMETTIDDGRTTHLLRLHAMTPDDRVEFTVWSPVIVVRVQVLGSDSKPLYDQERNGSLSGDIQPLHSDDITMRITELCSPCKYAGWEYVSYAQYSLYIQRRHAHPMILPKNGNSGSSQAPSQLLDPAVRGTVAFIPAPSQTTAYHP